MNFTIDVDSKIPIGDQLKDQVRYRIAVGDMNPGDELPSLRAMEADLGVHRNTVRKAFLDLRDEGLLDMVQGRRAVISRSTRSGLRPSSRDLEGMKRSILREVESQGLDALCFAQELMLEAKAHDSRHAKFGFVECSPEQAADMAAMVEAQWRRRVLPLELQSLDDSPPSSLRHVLTPHWHLAEVRKWSRGRGIKAHPVRVSLSAPCLARLRALRGRRVGLILRDAESIAGYRELIRKQIGTRQKIPVALMDQEHSRTSWMKSMEAVVFTTSCRAKIPTLIAEASHLQDHRVELVYEPNPHDLMTHLQEVFPWHQSESHPASFSLSPSSLSASP